MPCDYKISSLPLNSDTLHDSEAPDKYFWQTNVYVEALLVRILVKPFSLLSCVEAASEATIIFLIGLQLQTSGDEKKTQVHASAALSVRRFFVLTTSVTVALQKKHLSPFKRCRVMQPMQDIWLQGLNMASESQA